MSRLIYVLSTTSVSRSCGWLIVTYGIVLNSAALNSYDFDYNKCGEPLSCDNSPLLHPPFDLVGKTHVRRILRDWVALLPAAEHTRHSSLGPDFRSRRKPAFRAESNDTSGQVVFTGWLTLNYRGTR